LEVEFKFEVPQKIPENSKEFCETCFVLDPREEQLVQKKFSFNSGCKNEICRSNLKLKSELKFPTPFVLGTQQSVKIQYEISNSGEPAYLLKISLSLSTSQFTRISSMCKRENNGGSMLCDLNNGLQVGSGERIRFEIDLETSRLSGKSFKVTAEVSSSSEETFVVDNKVEDEIEIVESSNVEIEG
jgi:hypothetical protein